MDDEREQKLIDQESIKKANRELILNMLHKKRVLTKQEASLLTEISFPTVSNNIDFLVESGFAEEAGMADSTGGRKPVIYRFLPNSRYSLGVTIEPGAIRIVRVNLDIDIVDDFYFPYDKETSDPDLVGRILSSVQLIMQRNKLDVEKMLGVGIAVPGNVDKKHLILEISPELNVKKLSFLSLTKELRMPIYLEKEANAAALAELKLGIAKGMKNLVYIYLTQGVGAGMVIGGELYTGAHNRAGEIGHQTIMPKGKRCNCGKLGCWEMYISEEELLSMYRKKREGRDTSLKDFFNHLSYKDEKALAVWEEYLEYLSIGIHNIVAIYDPHYIVIGGNIAAYPQYLLPSLMKKVFGDSSLYMKNDTFILTSQLGRNSSVLGAALLPINSLLSFS